MKKIIKGIIFIVIIAIIGTLASSFLNSKKEESNSGLSSTTGATSGVLPGTESESSQAGSVSDQFLRLLLSMQDIELDQSIFVDPTFMALEDFSAVIDPRNNEGRPNPFAPVGREFTQSTISVPLATSSANPTQ